LTRLDLQYSTEQGQWASSEALTVINGASDWQLLGYSDSERGANLDNHDSTRIQGLKGAVLSLH
jgi:hypothetical protein